MANEKIDPSQELVKSLFDYKDGALYWKIDRPRGVKSGDMAGYISKYKDIQRYRVFIKNRLFVGARIIYLWHHGSLPEIVDHKDRNPLNNVIENLRAATKSQNQKNCKSAKGSSSKYIGVGLERGEKWVTGYRWKARIRHNGKNVCIGFFKEEVDAAIAYNQAAIKYNGDFASLNIID